MEVGGLGALISCDDYYNSILCTDWSRVYKTLSCVETSLVPRPHLVRNRVGKRTILKVIRAGVEFGSGTKTMTSPTSCPLDTSLHKICLYLAFHDITAHGKIYQIFLLRVCILEAINCWSRLIPRHTCMRAWE